MAQRSIATKLVRQGAYKISRRLGVTYLGDAQKSVMFGLVSYYVSDVKQKMLRPQS